jgi:hypothetical protein
VPHYSQPGQWLLASRPESWPSRSLRPTVMIDVIAHIKVDVYTDITVVCRPVGIIQSRRTGSLAWACTPRPCRQHFSRCRFTEHCAIFVCLSVTVKISASLLPRFLQYRIGPILDRYREPRVHGLQISDVVAQNTNECMKMTTMRVVIWVAGELEHLHWISASQASNVCAQA